MIDRYLKSVILIFSLLLLIACGPPIPVPIPVLPSNVGYITEADVQDMVENSLSRKRVIEKFGRPLRYREHEVSYEVCRKEGGFLIMWPPTAEVSERNYEYSELILKFDSEDVLHGYSKVPLRMPPDQYAEDMNLRKLGKQGDNIAQILWQRSETYYTSQEKEIIKEREMKERRYLKGKKEIISVVTQNAESGDPKAQFELYMLEDKTSPKWLCRSADQGYIDAEMWLGYVLETGSYGFPLDITQSYIWYRRAALGAHQQEVNKIIGDIKEASPKYYFGKGRLCDIAQKIVSMEDKLNAEKKLYDAEYMLEQWKPGDCERKYVDAMTDE